MLWCKILFKGIDFPEHLLFLGSLPVSKQFLLMEGSLDDQTYNPGWQPPRKDRHALNVD